MRARVFDPRERCGFAAILMARDAIALYAVLSRTVDFGMNDKLAFVSVIASGCLAKSLTRPDARASVTR